MTLYRCAYNGIEKGSANRGVLIHRVEKNEENKWVRTNNKDPITKITYNQVVLKLEIARLTNPFISINWNSDRTSEYHICLFRDETVAISDEKWQKYFLPIETKIEE